MRKLGSSQQSELQGEEKGTYVLWLFLYTRGLGTSRRRFDRGEHETRTSGRTRRYLSVPGTFQPWRRSNRARSWLHQGEKPVDVSRHVT